MLSFGAPLWLVGWLALPLIRWLHRGGPLRRARPVSRLALWRGAVRGSPAAGAQRPPDPAWRRRALLAALLLAALAQPQWPRSGPRVTLWIDDSPSLQLREAEGTRLAAGWAAARAMLAERPGAEVQVRRLGDPWRDLGPPGDAPPQGAQGDGRVPAPPPAALLSNVRLHWLITDGAHPDLLAWPDGRRPDRVVAVGSRGDNVGIQRLSARRHASRRGQVELLVQLTNGGANDAQRVLSLGADAAAGPWPQRLAPGASAWVLATVPATGTVRARLDPADALPGDDAIELDLSPLRPRRVALDPTCPAGWWAAVTAHPALAAVGPDAADADMALDCGGGAPPAALPTLRVRADRPPEPMRGPVGWATSGVDMPALALDPTTLRRAADLTPGPGDTVLLTIGTAPVLIERAAAPRRLETSLSLERSSTVDTSAHAAPLLANGMFELLLGQPLLDAVLAVDRGAGAARVVPTRPAQASASEPAGSGEQRPLVRALLLLAAAVCLWELAALARQWARLRDAAPAQPS